tara:strand:- start:165 stop:1100 length:936 start_codon:yes stop_codon:yes gene_type:complete
MTKVSQLPQSNLFNEKYHISGFEGYLKLRDYSASSVKIYLSSVNSLLSFIEIPLNEMNELHLIQYRDEMVGRQSLKPTTVNKNLAAIKVFVLYLLEEGALKNNISTNVKPIKIQQRKVAPKAMTEKEINLFLQTLARVSRPNVRYRNEAIVKLALNSGLRVSEICNVNREDFAFGDRSGSVTVKQGKGLKERSVLLNDKTRKALWRHLEYFQDKRGSPVLDSEPMFQSEQKTRISVRSIQIIIADTAKEAKIDRIKITPHVLRHTFATNYYQVSNSDVIGLASMMGHSSLNTTSIYAQPSEEQVMMDLEKL